MSSSGKLLFVSFVLLFFIFIPASAFCDEEPIAHLTDFTGIVLVKSRGEWAVKPVKNLPLHSMDKVVTRIGTATITFAGGATVDIKNNSNLLVREKEKGLIKKVEIVERRILLFMGKIFFKTGTEQVQTKFETEKTVIGIRGTAGVLSIGPDGEVYVMFTEGGAKKVLGKVISGQIAEDLPLKLADQNPIQKASYLAHAAYKKCLEAKQKTAKGEISPVQELWACAKAREVTAKEYIICAEHMIKGTPDPEEREWWEGIKEDEDEKLESAIKDQEDAIDQGAIPEPEEEYQPPEKEVEAEVIEEAEAYEPIEDEGENLSDPPIQDLGQDYEEEIPPIQDEEPSSPSGQG